MGRGVKFFLKFSGEILGDDDFDWLFILGELVWKRLNIKMMFFVYFVGDVNYGGVGEGVLVLFFWYFFMVGVGL